MAFSQTVYSTLSSLRVTVRWKMAAKVKIRNLEDQQIMKNKRGKHKANLSNNNHNDIT